MNNNKRGISTKKLTRGAVIAALYTALTYLCTLFGLSSGVIQLRVSEALCILPAFMPEAIPGLFIGCIISNLISACAPWDVVFGSIATLIGAFGAYLLRKVPYKLGWMITLPNILSNTLIVPFILINVYGAEEGLFFLIGTVGAGEIISAGILGSVLYYTLRKSKIIR